MKDCPLQRAWATKRWQVVLGVGFIVMLVGAIAAGAFWWGRQSTGRSGTPSAQAAAPLASFPEPPKLAPDGEPPGLRATAGTDSAAVRVGQPAPDFLLFRSGGGWLRLSQLRGKVVILNFWASWCPPCQMEMPWFKAAWEQGKLPSAAVLVGVDVQEEAQTVGRFLQQGGYGWPVALDTNGAVAMAYRVSGIPTTYLISAQGTVLKMHRGLMTQEMLIQVAQDAVTASQKEASSASTATGAAASGQKTS